MSPAPHRRNIADIPLDQLFRNRSDLFPGQIMNPFDHLIDCGKQQRIRSRQTNCGAVVTGPLDNIRTLRKKPFQPGNKRLFIHRHHTFRTKKSVSDRASATLTGVPVGISSSATAAISCVEPFKFTVTFPCSPLPAGIVI